MDKKIISAGAVFGFFGIIFGAFGAHAMKKILSVDSLAVFETAVRYQMYHALFLLFLGTVNIIPQKAKKIIFNFIHWGVFFFSGSLYTLALFSASDMDVKFIGILTPFGGTLLIIGWIWLFVEISRKKS
ncbi:DUF423 domain-containing protein [Flavobacterium pallidum]|uniref:DUF423 domain-containing protein n=1 Tax=Flavobacterium pallidum TaxID=2172098 RepID=A0A2S1SEM0_9FLAO|nr:DUF423 domain-containing protein [Flavobacterium pallidum]AWI24814.1 DUF423 domain-containing protein [Flavobacterium pallidum]